MQKKQYDQMYRIEDTHWWFCAKRLFISTLLPFPNGQLDIVDVGSGTGGTSQYLRQWGRITCIEPSRFAAPYLARRQLPFIASTLDDFDTKGIEYDIVLFLDVLYHKKIYSDVTALQKAFRILKPGGMVCITDCAIPQLFSHHDTEAQARERYTKQVLKSVVQKAGFDIVRCSYMYFLLFPLFLLQRLIDKRYPVPVLSPLPKSINTFLFSICRIESFLLSKSDLPIGSSLILIGRKPGRIRE